MLSSNRLFSLRLCLLLLLAAPSMGWAQNRAQALMQFEGVPVRYQGAYAPGPVSRDVRELLEPPDQAIAGGALRALDAAAARSFDAAAAMASVQRAVSAAGEGGAAPDALTLRAVAHLVQVRAEYIAMDTPARAEFFKRQQATPPDAARTELLNRMTVADAREVDFSNQLLLSAVVKQLARGNAGQFTALPDRTLDSAIDTLWSRGITSPHPRNLLAVARQFEQLVAQAQIAALSDEEVAALLAWRSDPQAGAEREALVGAYREQVKSAGARALRMLIRGWPRS
jgi:hypothetical protein